MEQAVQPLAWKNSTESNVLEAETPIGVYRLRQLPLGCAVSFHATRTSFFNVSDDSGVSLEQAYTLAQHDFDTRVRAFLTNLGTT